MILENLGKSDRDLEVCKQKEIQTIRRSMKKNGNSRERLQKKLEEDRWRCHCSRCYTNWQKKSKGKIKGINKRRILCEAEDD